MWRAAFQRQSKGRGEKRGGRRLRKGVYTHTQLLSEQPSDKSESPVALLPSSQHLNPTWNKQEEMTEELNPHHL